MRASKREQSLMKQDKGLWSTLQVAVLKYTRKCRNSYLSMFSF